MAKLVDEKELGKAEALLEVSTKPSAGFWREVWDRRRHVVTKYHNVRSSAQRSLAGRWTPRMISIPVNRASRRQRIARY